MALPKGMDVTIRKYALHNAQHYEGKASPGAVIGKILAENPAIKGQIKEIAEAVNAAIQEVNKLGVEKQTEELSKLAPELLEKKKPERKDLPALKNAVQGRVATRIPPEPSKYAHIGHALSFLINYMYAKKYDGKCYVRFEDTNAELAKKEYVDAMLEDFNYLGIKPTKITHISNDMPLFYELAEKLLKQGQAYVCTCNQDKMRELRHEGYGCSHRQQDAKTNQAEWKNMHSGKYKEGEAVLRLKGNMESPNHVMRDPVLFRISFKEHYLQGKKYSIWPLYDFANSVEDGIMNITHIMRSSEFGTMRVELQDQIKDLLKLPKQTVIQYGRFNVKGAVTQGREIRRMMDEGTITSWDDPRLVTIRALRRRGIQPETFWELAIEVGLSPSETSLDWQLIAAINRKILDPKCNRYFFVQDPQHATIKDAPSRKIELKLHPDIAEAATRQFSVAEKFLLAKSDADEIAKLKAGSLIRLMDCLNFKKTSSGLTFDSLDYETYKTSGSKIIHWLPAEDKNLLSAAILMPPRALALALSMG